MLLPMKGLPGYAGDWTIWFAEREQIEAGGSGAPMRAPLPVRKPIRADGAAHDVSPGVIQFSATMNKTGKMESITVIGNSGTAPNAAITDPRNMGVSLPALRNREAVAVDPHC